MDDHPTKNADDIVRFLDAPPTWFALVVWMYPLFYSIFCVVIAAAYGISQFLGYFFLFTFFASLIFLFQSSRWFRSRVAFMAPCWLFFVVACSSTTQGALTSAVSKAFSAVTSQLQNLSEVDVRERGLNQRSTEISQKEESLLRKTLATAEAQKPQSLEVARAANQLALCCFHQGKYEESETLFLKSLALREKLAGPNDPEVAESLIGLGLLYASRHQFEKAIVAHKRALSIDEKELGPNHPLLATDLRNLVNDYKGYGNLPESEKLLRRAVAIDGDVPKSKQAISPQ
jgi:tetratricopeptide (TPR) repeat protein